MSERLARGLLAAGFSLTQMETRRVAPDRAAQMDKTRRNDARGIVRLLRLGWFRPVRLTRAMKRARGAWSMSARKSLQGRPVDAGNSLRGPARAALVCGPGGSCAGGGTQRSGT
ncbi:hypothetical protein [Chachezhania sediminis]|uniref:hypothetical protein n=1 Tax=Chachezhania sediminis TaxID=2599291 RepID=UPI00131AA8A3|nr:hypothetical protein [Chachezhania sediminis]